MKKGFGNTVSIVTEIVKPIASSLNLEIWDVRFEKEGSMWILKVIIDKEDGVSLDDCESLSRPLDKKLDELDPIEQSYLLEVSSAGIERELTRDWHFEKLTGKEVMLKLIRPYENEREFIGQLICMENDMVSILVNGITQIFARADIAYVRLYIEF